MRSELVALTTAVYLGRQWGIRLFLLSELEGGASTRMDSRRGGPGDIPVGAETCELKTALPIYGSSQLERCKSHKWLLG